MRPPTRKRLSALLAAAALAALLSAVGAELDLPTAAADNQTSPIDSCSGLNGGSSGFGRHTCLGPDLVHYEITSIFHNASTTYNGSFYFPVRVVTCDQPSQSARCATPTDELGWVPYSNYAMGPFAHPGPVTSVTLGCASGQHVDTNPGRLSASCHSHSFTPPPTACGDWHPHEGASSSPAGHVPAGSILARPPHNWVKTGRLCTGYTPVGPVTPVTTPVITPVTPMLTVAGQTVDEDAGAADFTVTLSATATAAVTVDVATSDGTATSGSDYASVATRTVTIPASRTTAIVSVTVTDDSYDESDETFTLRLSNPSNADLSPIPAATATIRDDDDPAPVLVSISGSPTEEEGDSLVFSVSLDAAPTASVSVSLRVDDPHYQGHPLYLEEGPYCGFAPTTDYVEPSNTTLTWSAGDTTSRRVSIRTCDDGIDEQDKTLTVELYTASGAAIGVGSASGTITDNDDPNPYPTVTDPTFFVNSPTVEEGGELTFVVSFMPVGTNWWGSLTMDFSGSANLSAAGTECAAVGDDAHINRSFTTSQDTYTRSRNSGAGWVGGATMSLVLYTCDDTTPEALETLTAVLSTTPSRSATAADVGPDGVGTIIDNDNPEVDPGRAGVRHRGRHTLDFEVRLLRGSARGCDRHSVHRNGPRRDASRYRRGHAARLSADVELPGGHPCRVDVSNRERVHDRGHSRRAQRDDADAHRRRRQRCWRRDRVARHGGRHHHRQRQPAGSVDRGRLRD